MVGLVVDMAGSMVPVSATIWEGNPSTLGSRSKALFDGAYKLPAGLMVRLSVEKLRPVRLRETELFGSEGLRREKRTTQQTAEQDWERTKGSQYESAHSR